ncbi:6-phosphogluconolactonase [Nitzschia inconspicua]|uniref:6-phosphogluconolactonase n=1 Tax=Nitzschia inconspicua TaxID=303405 RepID=A0A9K3Q8B5_9STRA|nr:6-phosphogluconolactonase [Nitzschia inconspicua]
MLMNLLLLLVIVQVAQVATFVIPAKHTYLGSSGSSTTAVCSTATFPSTSPDQVIVLADADAVGSKIRSIVEDAAVKAIADHGHFYLAIPGGSILKMLVGSKGEWTKSTTIAYVNHKCVAMDDEKLATHAKAMNLFMKDWEGCNPIVLDGTADGPAEAAAYERKLENLANLPRDSDGLPVFDLALIGVGDDGHVGSLYPNRDEVLETKKWVLSVEMKDPPSISLSLPVMANAKEVVVAACGVSEKYPQGKSDAMKRAVVNEDETLQSFPAVGLRKSATWVMDEAAASKLGDTYNE